MLPTSLRDREVCILGLGYVGLTLAVAMADSGFRVHGVEQRADVLEMLERCEPHFWEPRLKPKLQRVVASGAFTMSQDVARAAGASVFIVTVGTPFRDGSAFLGSVKLASRQVAEIMQEDALVILRSTVKLGTARQVVAPVLERTGRAFDLAVCPERTLEGRALIELHELPQIIGADDADTRARCANLFNVLTPTTVTLSSLEAAEMTKLVDNTYRDVTFGFANEVARLCSAAGLSAREIIRAGRLGYPRTAVALPGPVGGPCLEKDPHILCESAAAFGIDMMITRSARHTNEIQPGETANVVLQKSRMTDGFPTNPVIALAGLAFKGVPATDDLRGSMAKPIHDKLRAAFPTATFRAYDPVVPPALARDFLGDVEACDTLEKAVDGANLLVIMNNHPRFATMDLTAITQTMRQPAIIYDYWNMHDDVDRLISPETIYMALGSEDWKGTA